jgi:hypothetical protein
LPSLRAYTRGAMERDRTARLAQGALLLLFVAAALVPIRSYDYFWHLATGRWIVQERALPATDPFALASDRVPWVNGEWLFQLPVYALHAAGGDALLALIRALVVGGLFYLIWWRTRGDGDDGQAVAAFALTAIAFAAAAGRLDVRPSTCAAVFVAIAIVLLERPPSLRRDLLYALLTIVWINTHPSALLAPAIAVVAVGLQIVTKRSRLIEVARIGVSSALALLVNPYGWHGIAAPIELTAFVRHGGFVNAEWLPSLPGVFPLFYLSIAVALGVLLYAMNRREHLWRIALFAIFAILAIRYVRNQGLYAVAMPLLIAPLIPPMPRPDLRKVALGAGLAALVWVFVTDSHTAGIDERRFPVGAVRVLRASGLGGHIYNPDQFGGFLIWNFHPPRRVLTDGRNELYRVFLPEYAKARVDGRAWNALLRKYSITLAVEEYRREPMEVTDAVTKRRRKMPASLIYFPRNQWALIAFDDAAMVFARRAAYPRDAIARLEYPLLVPDGEQLFDTPAARAEAARELLRAHDEVGEQQVLTKIAREIQEGARSR